MDGSGAPAGDSSATVTDGSVDEGSGDAPLTTTQSGIPIAPVFSAFSVRMRRRKCFDEGYGVCR